MDGRLDGVAVFASGIPRVTDNAVAMRKKVASTVFMWRQRDAFQVQTNEGLLGGKPGDFLAYDPDTKHCWPVSAEYVELHYEPLGAPCESGAAHAGQPATGGELPCGGGALQDPARVGAEPSA